MVQVGTVGAHDEATHAQGGGASDDGTHVEGVSHRLQEEDGGVLTDGKILFLIYYNKIVEFVNIFCDGYDAVGGIFLRNFLKKAILHPENGASDVGEGISVQLRHAFSHLLGRTGAEEHGIQLHYLGLETNYEQVGKKSEHVLGGGWGEHLQ